MRHNRLASPCGTCVLRTQCGIRLGERPTEDDLVACRALHQATYAQFMDRLTGRAVTLPPDFHRGPVQAAISALAVALVTRGQASDSVREVAGMASPVLNAYADQERHTAAAGRRGLPQQPATSNQPKA